ncbi:hypothetical protein ACP70R_009103 [Stipagrostis hirtigluma subsp. patula]
MGDGNRWLADFGRRRGTLLPSAVAGDERDGYGRAATAGWSVGLARVAGAGVVVTKTARAASARRWPLLCDGEVDVGFKRFPASHFGALYHEERREVINSIAPETHFLSQDTNYKECHVLEYIQTKLLKTAKLANLWMMVNGRRYEHCIGGKRILTKVKRLKKMTQASLNRC